MSRQGSVAIGVLRQQYRSTGASAAEFEVTTTGAGNLHEGQGDSAPRNRDLLWPYAAPYFAYILIAAIPGDVLKIEYNYFLRIAAAGLLIVRYWKIYLPLRGPLNPFISGASGALAGFFGIAAWIWLVGLFPHPAAAPWTEGYFPRVVAAGFLVPLFEELFIRRFVLGVAFQWDILRASGVPDPFQKALDEESITSLRPGAWSVNAALISTLVFASGHQPREWLASLVFGLLMVWLLAWRKDLISCISAHMTANLALAAYVRLFGQWQLW